MSHQKVISFIKTVRESFPDSSIVYQYGACYGFYKILKSVFPNAVAYYDPRNDHVVTKIDKRFYDIVGEYTRVDLTPRGGELTKVGKDQHVIWESVAHDQKFEYMYAKYQRECKKIANPN